MHRDVWGPCESPALASRKPQALNPAVPTTPQFKYPGSMISWKNSLEHAFRHGAALAEEAYKKWHLVWNSYLTVTRAVLIFQTTFTPGAFVRPRPPHPTHKHLPVPRIDAYFHCFFQGSIRIRASFSSCIFNLIVWEQSRRLQLPSTVLLDLAPRAEPVHAVVFAAAHKDSLPRPRINPHDKYTKIARIMRTPINGT